MKLTSELIYEAALDDQLFAQLPSIISSALDARSCVLHWRHQNGAAEIFAHSNYFSDVQMANYSENFVEHDLWTAAGIAQSAVNRAWTTTDLVPAAEYERSIFYNDWIRAMGDDTFYCCGSVMRTAYGHGIIGLHRGRTQADFSPQALHELTGYLDHLRRMFAIRGRISELTQRHDLLEEIFARGRQPAFMLGHDGRILQANAVGDAFLAAGQFLSCRSGQLKAAIGAERGTIERALALATSSRDPRASDCLIRGSRGGVVAVWVTPLPEHSRGPSALMTIDEPQRPLPRDMVSRHLQSAYDLSAAEAEIALRLAEGQTTRDISDERRSSPATVRTQVKHILSKMDARRQADVIRAIAHLVR